LGEEDMAVVRRGGYLLARRVRYVKKTGEGGVIGGGGRVFALVTSRI